MTSGIGITNITNYATPDHAFDYAGSNAVFFSAETEEGNAS